LGNQYMQYILERAIKYRKIHIIVYLIKIGVSVTAVIIPLIKKDNVDILKLLCMTYDRKNNYLSVAVSSGSIHSMKYLHELGYKFNSADVRLAFKTERLNIIKYVHENMVDSWKTQLNTEEENIAKYRIEHHLF
jgi:hypothetical protein